MGYEIPAELSRESRGGMEREKGSRSINVQRCLVLEVSVDKGDEGGKDACFELLGIIRIVD